MGCQFSTLKDEQEPIEAFKTEPTHLTERPSSEDEASSIVHVAFEAAEISPQSEEGVDDYYPEPPSSNTSLVFVRPAIMSQLSDTVDLCEEMKEGELRDRSEAVLEHIVRAQYQVDQQGDAVPESTATAVRNVDAHFKAFLEQYANKRDPPSVFAAQKVLDNLDRELESVRDQFESI